MTSIEKEVKITIWIFKEQGIFGPKNAKIQKFHKISSLESLSLEKFYQMANIQERNKSYYFFNFYDKLDYAPGTFGYSFPGDMFHISCFIDSSFCFIFLITLVLEPGVHCYILFVVTSYQHNQLSGSFTGFWYFCLYFKLMKGFRNSFVLRYPIFKINTEQRNFILNQHFYKKNQ